MKSKTRSSRIPLPPEELDLVLALQTKLKDRSKIEVVRRGLQLPKEMTDRERLGDACRRASLATRALVSKDSKEHRHCQNVSLGIH
jgi:hypothetical protein